MAKYFFENIYTTLVRVPPGVDSTTISRTPFPELPDLVGRKVRGLFFCAVPSKSVTGDELTNADGNIKGCWITILDTYGDPFIQNVPGRFFAASSLDPGIGGINILSFEPRAVDWKSSYISSVESVDVTVIIDYI